MVAAVGGSEVLVGVAVPVGASEADGVAVDDSVGSRVALAAAVPVVGGSVDVGTSVSPGVAV